MSVNEATEGIAEHGPIAPTVEAESNPSPDMRGTSNIGHFGTGDLETRLSSREDFEHAKPLLNRNYDAS